VQGPFKLRKLAKWQATINAVTGKPSLPADLMVWQEQGSEAAGVRLQTLLAAHGLLPPS
jgi:hypothetical protein